METRKRAYTVAEAAETLSVSTWLVREAIRRGQLRCARIGTRIIIPAAVIDEILGNPDTDASTATPQANPVAVDQGVHTNAVKGTQPLHSIPPGEATTKA